MKGYIYKYTFPNRKVYIGQTRRDPSMRQREHISEIEGPTNTGFWEAYQEFGTYEFEIIRTIECENVEELVKSLNLWESYYIIQNKAFDRKYGYNIRMFGTSHTDKNAILQEYRLERLQEILPDALQICLDIELKLFETQEYLTEKEKKYLEEQSKKFQLHNFPSCCKNINKVIKNDRIVKNNINLHEFYEEMKRRLKMEVEDKIAEEISCNENDIIQRHREEHLICQLDEQDNIIATYSTYNDAAFALGKKTTSAIRETVKGKWKQAYGYKWKLKKDLNL